ncbi:MAG: adenylate/guanylate cyclase domain-containing protein [Pseudomonadota bacterium]
MKRKLTTILCADGVAFGKLMEADEDFAMGALQRRREIMRELFETHDGRQVNTWGDSIIAEFGSVVEAVRCAVAIQEAIESENATMAKGRRLQFRVGVNLGDVMIDGEDLYGDGVNVAARLQEMADPGGIMVSGAVHDFAHKQLAVGFDFIGEQKVKSIEEPVKSYAVRMSRRNAPMPAGVTEKISIRDEDAMTQVGQRADGIINWLRAQPKGVQRSAGMILFFFMINLLFSGIAMPWFIFPSAPFAWHIWRHARRTRDAEGPGQEAK